MWKLECSIWREDDWYVSECKDLEIASQGRTLEEAQDNLQEAIRLFLEAASFTKVMNYLSRLESDTPTEILRNLEVQFTPIDQGDHTTVGELTLAFAWIESDVNAEDSQGASQIIVQLRRALSAGPKKSCCIEIDPSPAILQIP